jgi:hypothetical protein
MDGGIFLAAEMIVGSFCFVVFMLTFFFFFLFVYVIQTLDVLLQVLVVFPKVEPLRSKVS